MLTLLSRIYSRFGSWMIIAAILTIVKAPVYAACPIDLDVYQLHHYSYRAVKYDVAMEILNYFKPYLSLAAVGVGVLDVGFYENPQIIGQLIKEQYRCKPPVPSDADLENMSDEERISWAFCMHGTAVTSVLSAVNGDGQINGYLAVLQNGHGAGLAPVYYTYEPTMLEIPPYIGLQQDANIDDLRQIMANVQALIEAGAEVISMSMRLHFSPSHHDEIAQGQREWNNLLANHPNVVFVVSAGNSDRRLYPEEFPQCVSGTNQIVVGGLQKGEDGGVVRWQRSNYGPGIHIYAPAHRVPVIRGRGFAYADGTSFAVPIVSALAVMLKSIQPTLTGADVKRIILDSADRSNPTLPVLDFAKAIMNTIKQVPYLPPQARALFNTGRHSLELYPSDLLVRICEHAEITHPQRIVLLGDSGVPLNTIVRNDEYERIAHGGLGAMPYFNMSSSLRSGPALNWAYHIDRPRGITNLSFDQNKSMIYLPDAALPAQPAMNGLLYGTITGTTKTTTCRYYTEKGRSYNPLTGDMAENRRILFSNGHVSATLHACRTRGGGSSTSNTCENCPILSEPLGPSTPHKQRLKMSFTNLHHFIHDDQFWDLTRDTCSYFFDL